MGRRPLQTLWRWRPVSGSCGGGGRCRRPTYACWPATWTVPCWTPPAGSPLLLSAAWVTTLASTSAIQPQRMCGRCQQAPAPSSCAQTSHPAPAAVSCRIGPGRACAYRVMQDMKMIEARRLFEVRLRCRVNFWNCSKQTWHPHTCVAEVLPQLHSVVLLQPIQKMDAMPPLLPPGGALRRGECNSLCLRDMLRIATYRTETMTCLIRVFISSCFP